MALFSRKTDEEKAAKKAAKDARAARRKDVASRVGGAERLNYGTALNVAADELRDEEQVLMVATGEEDNSDAKAALIATDQRIIIGTIKGMNIGHTELLYPRIDKIDTGSKLSGAWITLYSGSQTTQIEKSATKNLDRLVGIIRERQSTTTTAPAGDGLDQLAKLADLHQAGILTDEEFAAAKAKALGL